MTPAQVGFFAAARITGIMNGLTDPRLNPVPLVWNQRIPDVDAIDEEIFAKYVGTPIIADLIMDDAKGVIYSHGRFQFETTQAPNIKMGYSMNQAMMNAMGRIRASGGVLNDDVGFFSGGFNRLISDARYGVEQRKEMLKIAMLCDGLTYDRLGIKLSAVTWGMYADLKVTVGTAWGTGTTANAASTPITDIQTVRQLAMARYNIDLNRATMSTSALRMMVQTTEFQAQIKNVAFATLLGGPAPTSTLQGDAYTRRIAELVIGGVGTPFVIEIDDRRFWAQGADAAISSIRFHPIGTVLLTATGNDGNRGAYDFANAPVTEGALVGMAPSSVAGGSIPTGRGPIGYMTLADPALNPPGVVCWSVARGFPRKHMNQASSALNIGALTETFDTTVPAVL